MDRRICLKNSQTRKTKAIDAAIEACRVPDAKQFVQKLNKETGLDDATLRKMPKTVQKRKGLVDTYIR